MKTIAHVAQSVERFLGKEEVHRFDSDRGLHLGLSIDPPQADQYSIAISQFKRGGREYGQGKV